MVKTKITDHGFPIFEGVFSLPERWLMKRQLQKECVKLPNERVVGLQSPSNLHKIVAQKKYFNFYKKISKCINPENQFKLEIVKSWINHQDKNTPQNWHRHSYCTMTCVYFLTNPEGLGTEYQIDTSGGPIRFSCKMKENSLLCLPGKLLHSAPAVKNKKERYSIAVDFNVFV